MSREMVKAMPSKPIAEGSGRVKVIDGVPVIVLRHKGEYLVYVAVCPHLGYVLCDRAVRDGRLACPGHGEVFRVADGSPEKGLARQPLLRLAAEAREDGFVYIERPGEEVKRWISELTKPS